ncbi:transposase [Nocardia sp. AG03]|uniref:transposase n=1 Tax=Nocardia sp. AG03 TaxID=3025312 RepID=UPI002418527B|nr:transposase [Nocardia sp. AG03]
MAAPWIVDDESWAAIEPLLPVKPAGTPGPAQHDPRLVFQGILFVLFTGIGWEDLPQKLGFGSGMTRWRRLRDWQAAGVFEAMHQAVLDRSNAAGLIDYGRVMIDGSHVQAKKGECLMRAPVLDRVRPLRGRPGPPRRRLGPSSATRATTIPACTPSELAERGITGYIPHRGTRDKTTAGR